MVRGLKIVFILALFLIMAPVMVTASETVSYNPTKVPVITSQQQGAVELGSLVIEIDPMVEGEHSAVIALPRGYSVNSMGGIQAVEDSHVSLATSVTGQRNEFRIYIDYEGVSRKLTFVVPIKTIIPLGETGDIQILIKGMQGQFTNGEVIIGRIARGEVAISSASEKMRVIRPETMVPFSIDVAEDRGDVLRSGDETLKFVLPQGFNWQQTEIKTDVISEGGYLPIARVDTSNTQILYVDIQSKEQRKKGVFRISGLIMAERTLLPGSELRIEASGKDLARALNVVLVQVVEPEMEARFIVGSEVYYSNGRVLTMDVLPYTKEGRLFLPLRYVGLSLGVEPDDVKWNGQVASLTLEGKTVQVRPGVKQILVNGSTVDMDVDAEVQFPGRVMLPYRFIAEAFGAAIDWDSNTRTVTMEL